MKFMIRILVVHFLLIHYLFIYYLYNLPFFIKFHFKFHLLKIIYFLFQKKIIINLILFTLLLFIFLSFQFLINIHNFFYSF